MTHLDYIADMDDDALITRLEHAAKATATSEKEILKTGKVERTFTAHFAQEIAKTLRVDGIRVDPFCNKHRGAAKYLNGRIIELDIAVHERNTDTRNLVAIELETSNSPTGDDLWKLKMLTERLHGYGYRLGLYVVFGIEAKAGEILSLQWFKRT